MADKVKWGIIGTGSIARKLAESLKVLTDAQLTAVGSRSKESADAFADQYGISNRHGSYDGLARDPDVDIVYIATPHPFHKENSMLCLEHGKAVLCEKPFTINAVEAEELIRYARGKQLFLMEAMWTRFLPLMVRCKQIIDSGAIGDIRMIQADFGFRAEIDPHGRVFNPALGGGGLLDVGIYPISLACWILGIPSQIVSQATIGETGVDEQCAAVMKFDGGQLAIASAAVRTNTAHEAVIMGTDGLIRIPLFWRAQQMTVMTGDKVEEINEPYESHGYQFEAAECMRCLREGKLESDIISLNESLSIMRVLDTMRAQWGMKYPTE